MDTPNGQRAIRRFRYPSYIDGSCRREPDFQSRYPSISSLCRGASFVPRLRQGDEILYLTVKKTRERDGKPHRRLVAYLRVIRIFCCHQQAAAWYRSKSLPVPSNCLIPGSRPLPVSKTSGVPRDIADQYPVSRQLREWEKSYKVRSLKTPRYVATKGLHLFLRRPPVVTDAMIKQVFGRPVGTQTPPNVQPQQLRQLFSLAVGREARP